MSVISPETALIYAMVIISASDREMNESELARMGEIVRRFPAFRHYDENRLLDDARSCADVLQDEEGVEAALGLMVEAIPHTHSDLLYTVACDIAAIDDAISPEEARILEVLRNRFRIDRLTAAAIERATAARRKIFHMTA